MVKLPIRCGASKEKVMSQEMKHPSENQQTKWVLLPNGKMWKMVKGRIDGIVTASGYEEAESLEQRLDTIAEAATGFSCGLEDFGYEYLGHGQVKFSGKVGELMIAEDEEDDEVLKEVDPSSEQFYLQLIKQYGLLEVEAKHACENLDNDYGEETVVQLGNGREIRTTLFPAEASYVRVCIAGFELAYWVEEWHEKGEDVMGAFIGAMNRGMNAEPREEATC
jgi:hypothetical protein